MDIARIALSRHTCKAYDPNKKIPADKVEQIKTLLRFSPSSVNSQPWHFIIASSDAGKGRIAKAAQQGRFANNGPKIMNASHVVVLCARRTLEDEHLARLLAQEAADGRLPTPEAREAQQAGRSFYANLHRQQQNDARQWMEKQVYLALGTLLLGAAVLEIDATPIEGFDAHVLDEELALLQQGWSSVVMVALGYRSAEDFNAKLPKSRLSANEVITEL